MSDYESKKLKFNNIIWLKNEDIDLNKLGKSMLESYYNKQVKSDNMLKFYKTTK